MHLIPKKTLLSAAVTLVVFASQLSAGAWTQKKRGYFLKLSGNYLSTTSEFNFLGKKNDIFAEHFGFTNASFRDFNISFYGEYGLSSRFTVISSLAFKSLQSNRTELIGGGQLENDVAIHTPGFSDLWLSGRYNLLKLPLVFSLQGGVKIPLGYAEEPSNSGAALGTANFDGELQLLVGQSLHPTPIYLTAGGGYRTRGGRFHDEWIYSFEAGYTLKKTLFKITLDGIHNAKRPIPDIYGMTVITPLPGGGGVRPVSNIGNQDVLKISPSIFYSVQQNIDVQLELINIVAGKNSITGSTFSLGIILKK